MTKSHPVLLLFIALVVSLSFAVPVEDVPETPYDESESLPYESAPVVCIAAPEAIMQAPAEPLRAPRFRFDRLEEPGARQIVRDTGWDDFISDSLIIRDHFFRC